MKNWHALLQGVFVANCNNLFYALTGLRSYIYVFIYWIFLRTMHFNSILGAFKVTFQIMNDKIGGNVYI